MASDAGNLLAQDEPFAVCYWDDREKRVFSLRSVAQGVDVSEIARAFGGGGHRQAAGFSLSFEEADRLFREQS
jgi:nanoRNase/pAp phosphatase (c-di-AMP/oligoRNAs hydrolase)